MIKNNYRTLPMFTKWEICGEVVGIIIFIVTWIYF